MFLPVAYSTSDVAILNGHTKLCPFTTGILSFIVRFVTQLALVTMVLLVYHELPFGTF